MSYPRPHLNAARRRARKRALARRDGRHCTYCGALFAADLRDASIDHVVPISLFRTWRTENLVLACRPCNEAKADRLPLSIALLLCAQWAGRRAVQPLGVKGSGHADAVHEQPIDTVHERSGGAVRERSGERVGRSIGEVFTPDWSLLARLAVRAERGLSGSLSGQVRTVSGPLATPQRSMADLPVRLDREADRSSLERTVIRRPTAYRSTPAEPTSAPVDRAGVGCS
ncbi:HNH endonuclease [Streptomyces sp. NPDC090442]|uniref:HNH endonuclease n=1 Tax=Streptomyces sp. NPDC090442 TaxID=3365962 RepID=UPI0037F42E61